MKRQVSTVILALACAVVCVFASSAARAADLVIVDKGKAKATVVHAANASDMEKKAVADLVKFVGQMSGAELPTKEVELANAASTVNAFAKNGPVLVVGEAALKAKPALSKKLNAALKKNPILSHDGIVVVRDGNAVYLAGNMDRGHYYAVAELLWRWGCRFYIPTEFGECIPDQDTLTIGDLDYAYGSPFEIRSYWISWVGDNAGKVDFQLRNMMSIGRSGMPSSGHALGKYTRDAPGSKGTFNFPITAPETAQHVAAKLDEQFANSQLFSVGMEDGSYDSAYPKDQELMKLQYDKYFMRWSVTDPMLELYNNVAKILQDKHPNSDAKMGFLAYANMTIPPVREMKAEPSLYCELAPIDIDPNHGMDDVDSPPRQEFGQFMHEWAKIMDGRLSIYDYDQGMLVWRDIPNPSHMAFKQDVKHYAKAGILGVNTESRNAIGTTFLNLFFRGRLMWQPDADVDALLDEFYPKFYGPAAEPMRTYWTTIYDAWDETIVTEHEHFAIPAIYTPEVMAVLDKKIVEAEAAVAPIVKKAERTRNEQRYVERMQFTRYSYDILKGYTEMAKAAATNVEYAKAAQFGDRALAVRENMTDMSGIFTTYRRYGAEKNLKNAAWWPGEVEQYRRLSGLTDGDQGKLVKKLPVEWAFHRDDVTEFPLEDWVANAATVGSGIEKGYHTKPVDLTYWDANKDGLTLDNRKDYPTDQWEMIRTDLYAQAQGVRHPDRQSYIGVLWYRTDVEMTAAEIKGGKLHMMFPGLFNECWLYINGAQVAYRKQGVMWWLNSYNFEWDVDVSEHLKAGKNTIALRCFNPHHFGGMFRRPFIYRAAGE